MSFLRLNQSKFLWLSILLCLCSCGEFFNTKEDKAVLARVGDAYLYEDAIAPLITKGMSAQDSAAFVANYINKWAAKQLLLSKSKINLPEDQLAAFDRLVADYRADLYTKAYLEALVQQAPDTIINNQELNRFYEQRKENFRLDQKLVQLRFAVLPQQFLNKEEVVARLRDYSPADKAFLDSIAVQFTKLHLNDSLWVEAGRVMQEIPVIDNTNANRYLKKSQFFELQDSLGVYLGKVTNVLQANDVAPLTYIEPSLRQIILNRRRLDKTRKLEKEILDEAIKKNEFELYDNK